MITLFRSRVETSHVRVNVTNDTFRVEQVIRVIQPSILTSGVYTCKVATFTSEQITSHNLLIFGMKRHNQLLLYYSPINISTILHTTM